MFEKEGWEKCAVYASKDEEEEDEDEFQSRQPIEVRVEHIQGNRALARPI